MFNVDCRSLRIFNVNRTRTRRPRRSSTEFVFITGLIKIVPYKTNAHVQRLLIFLRLRFTFGVKTW